MADEELKSEDSEDHTRAQALRADRAARNQDTEEGREEAAGSSDEEKEEQKRALTIMTILDVAGDLIGAIPFLGGIVRLITGVGAIMQSLKLSPAIRVNAWIINGVMSLIEVALSFIGLNILPTQTIGALIIRKMANSGGEEKIKQPE